MNDEATAETKTDRVRPYAGWLTARPEVVALSLLALTVLFGLQVLRVLVPGVVWLLGDRLSLGAIEAGGLMALVFLIAFLAGLLRRLLGDLPSVLVTAGGLGLMVLLIQILSGDPLINLILAMVGTALFVLFPPLYLRRVWLQGRLGMGHLALGLLVGLILDTAIHGGFGTYDVAWQTGLGPLLLTIFLVLAQWLLLGGMALSRNGAAAGTPGSIGIGVPRGRAFTWIAIGPFLFLQLVVFQNIARLAVLTGWPLPWAYGWTLLAQLIGLGAATMVLIWGRRMLWPWAVVCGLGLIAILVVPYGEGTVTTAILFLLGQVLLSLLMAFIFIGIGVSVQRPGFSGMTVANGLAMLILMLFLLAYYAGYDMTLPYSNVIIEPIAAFIVAACALSASLGPRWRTGVMGMAWLAPALAVLLLIVPLVGAVTWQEPTPVTGDGFPVRIMTYNLHNGFNTQGRLDVESLAQVIEDNDPDIVALQEISRGWLVSGRLDMLTWLSQRLDLPYVFGPTADPFWGNAILSRYPVLNVTEYELPPRNLFILRGLTVASIDLGDGDQIQVIATHFHHLEEDSGVRKVQSQFVVDLWDGAPATVFLGDLNAEPQHPEMGILRDAGLSDATTGKDGAELTFPSYDPEKRIDYIWVSPDLSTRDIKVPKSTASDHLPVMAEIYR